MLKITTKRDEREEEALRQEGRDQASREESERHMDGFMKRQMIYAKDAHFITASELREGDYLYDTDSGLRSGHRGARIHFVGGYYPAREDHPESPTKDGWLWVEYEGDPYSGVRDSGGSLIEADSHILIVNRDVEVRYR